MISDHQNPLWPLGAVKVLIQTSYQWEPVFRYKAHSGSDLEKTSMSMRFSQEMVSSTLVAKFAAPSPGTGAPPVAMAALYTTRFGRLGKHTLRLWSIRIYCGGERDFKHKRNWICAVCDATSIHLNPVRIYRRIHWQWRGCGNATKLQVPTVAVSLKREKY